MRKKYVKFVAVVLCISIMCGGFSINMTAYAQINTETSVVYPELEGVAPETIVAYFHGIPVRACNIDVNGFIDVGSLIQPYALPPYSDLTISSSDRGKVIYLVGNLATVGFGQKETYFFMPNKYIADMYSHLSSGSTEQITNWLIGLIPVVGPIYGFASLLSGLKNTQMLEDLDDIRRAGGDAYISITSTPYGTFKVVREWDGWTIPGNDCSTTSGSVTTTYTVETIVYGYDL